MWKRIRLSLWKTKKIYVPNQEDQEINQNNFTNPIEKEASNKKFNRIFNSLDNGKMIPLDPVKTLSNHIFPCLDRFILGNELCHLKKLKATNIFSYLNCIRLENKLYCLIILGIADTRNIS